MANSHQIRITSSHKRFDLANRKLSRLVREKKAISGTLERRDKSGRFSKRGTSYTFVLTLKTTMIETIIAVTYPYRTTSKGGGYFSYVARFYTPSKPSAKLKKKFMGRLIDNMKQSLDVSEDKPLWFYVKGRSNEQQKEVEYNSQRIKKAFFEDERTNLQR